MTLFIFSSSAIRFALLLSLPAVSHIRMSVSFAFADCIPSYITAAGSVPSSCLTMLIPILSAQMESCSPAAALKVSAAARLTVFPSFLSLYASLPMVVVFPPPFMPIISITRGVLSVSFCLSPLSSISDIILRNMTLTVSGFLIFSFLTVSRILSIICIVVSMPMSEVISTSSMSSNMSSSISARAVSTSLILSDILPKKPLSFFSSIFLPSFMLHSTSADCLPCAGNISSILRSQAWLCRTLCPHAPWWSSDVLSA